MSGAMAADGTAGGWRRAARFILAGGTSTALSIAVYQAALALVGYVAAYALGYASGVAFSYYAYAKHVFRTRMSWARLAAFVAFYVMALAAGSALNAVLVEQLGINARLSVFLAVAIMLPVNYFGSAWVLGAARGERRP